MIDPRAACKNSPRAGVGAGAFHSIASAKRPAGSANSSRSPVRSTGSQAEIHAAACFGGSLLSVLNMARRIVSTRTRLSLLARSGAPPPAFLLRAASPHARSNQASMRTTGGGVNKPKKARKLGKSAAFGKSKKPKDDGSNGAGSEQVEGDIFHLAGVPHAAVELGESITRPMRICATCEARKKEMARKKYNLLYPYI